MSERDASFRVRKRAYSSLFSTPSICNVFQNPLHGQRNEVQDIVRTVGFVESALLLQSVRLGLVVTVGQLLIPRAAWTEKEERLLNCKCSLYIAPILREYNVHNVAQEAVVLAQRRVVCLADQAQ